MSVIEINETFVNATKGHRYEETGFYETRFDNRGGLFRALQQEYGGCQSAMYRDVPCPDAAHSPFPAVPIADRRAAAAVETAEAQIAAGGRGISFEKLHNLRDRARHATLTAQGARERAERDRVAARLAALEALGEQADSLAASDGGGIPAALQAVADAVARVRTLAGEWDANVGALTAAARELGAEAAAPAGPRKTSAFVAVTGDGLTHKRTQLRPVAGKIEQVLAHAVTGDIISAVAAARLVTQLPASRRADHYLRGSNGLIVAQDGTLNPGMEAQLRAGNLTPLTESEIQRYLAGELA